MIQSVVTGDGKYRLRCKRGACYRKQRQPGEKACRIVIDGIDRGLCKFFDKRRKYEKVKVEKYKAVPLGQVVHTLLMLKGDPRHKLSDFDKRQIDEFVTWLQKRMHKVQLHRSVVALTTK